MNNGENLSITITVLYNNVPTDTKLTTAWGMSCLIEGPGKNILFDTGGQGHILLDNMAKLGKDPGLVQTVVLSHIHGDHTGGLGDFLAVAGEVEIYVPASFPEEFKHQAQQLGHQIISVSRPIQILPGVFSTGEMGRGMKEQALIVQTKPGLVVITGCAHPGIVNLVHRAREVAPGDLYLVMGGFHLMGLSPAAVQEIISALKKDAVQKVGPSHCTGPAAMAMFRQAWGDDFLDLGCGGQVRIPILTK